jgi:phosphodiesterase/alkaline phosphatase D-like protein
MGISGDRVENKRHLSRREFVGISGMSAAALLLGTGALSSNRALAKPFFADAPFKLGVASGDPLPDGVVLWTRLAPEPLAEDGSGGLPQETYGVRYEVAEDENFKRIVKRGAAEATPELGHSVHPEVRGLRPGREYYYRFKAGPEVSPVGRTKTAPDPGSSPDRLAFALASCQSWAGGPYSPYRNMAEEDLDLVVHVGDYIYERGNTRTLADFRYLHSLYKTSPDLRAAHAAFPFIATFDDHEVDNNWAGDVPQDSTPNFLELRANSFQAYYENLPLRVRSRPEGADILLYRKLTFGDLVEFNVLDTRQYRSDQVEGSFIAPRDPDAFDPSLTMTGEEQERWLFENLESSTARWNVLAQQTIVAQYDYDTGEEVSINHDQWDGYVAARDELLGFIQRRRPSNPVVISGDWHSSWVNDLKANFDDPDSETVATEFVGTSISSGCGWRDRVEAALEENPHVKFFDGNHRGYVRCVLTPDRWTTDFRAVQSVTPSESPIGTLASFYVASGEPGARRIGGVEVSDVRADTMFNGRPNPVYLTLRNSADEPMEVTVSAQVPEGWNGGSASRVLAPSEEVTLELPVKPPAGVTPLAEDLTVEVSIPGDAPIYGVFGGMRVVSVPRGDEVPLALDAGDPTSPLLDTYARLSPREAWDPARGYGWVEAAPISRDRGGFAALQRDFVLDRGDPITLRLAVPTGRREVYVLTGDASFASGNTIVRENGELLAQSGDKTIPEGRFEWFGFELDGGPSGRTADLEITGDLRAGYWRMGGIVMLPAASG